ncbi:MAG: glutathione S-transferase family protein [Paracoccaceae bacterium]|nr:glutathione S-transferase family protein [Paracoccaceae bacterium]
MKLHTFGPAANGRRVAVFLAEKGLEIETSELKVREGAQFEEPFTTMNPFHCVPFLELDSGQIIAESIAICRYLEAKHPENPLFGRTDEEKAEIEMWLRRVELDAFIPLLHAVRNAVPSFAGRVLPGTRSDLPQLSVMTTRGVETATLFFDRTEPLLAGKEFLAGDEFSIADIIGALTVNMAKALEMDIEAWPNVHRWHQVISTRPSMQG